MNCFAHLFHFIVREHSKVMLKNSLLKKLKLFPVKLQLI